MRAAVLTEYNQPLVIEELEDPPLGPRDVRVQVDVHEALGDVVEQAALLQAIDLDVEERQDWEEIKQLVIESYRHFALKRMLKALDEG